MTANTFTGSGAELTNLDYNNISINKPDIYTKTEVNDISTLTNFYNKTESDAITTNLYSSDMIIYTEERKYPPKIYDNSTYDGNVNAFGKWPVIKETITLNTNDITYGSGTYNIYSSTGYSGRFKKLLFDEIYNNPSGWSFNYDYATGYYLSGRTQNIKSDYLGDWLIVELPNPIFLTRFIFNYNQNTRAPGLWRCYGSNDGITFTEIPEASNEVNAITANYYSTIGYYQQILSPPISTAYKYIGFTVNKLSGNDGTLIIGELQLFWKRTSKTFLCIFK